MRKAPTITFANLTCTFGPHGLLDFALEIVIPAFTDQTLKRKYGETKYFFHKVGFVDVSVENRRELQLTVYGEIVKDTVLKRTQIYSDRLGLIPDEQSIPSAPSAFFALNLNNHKLIFLPETADAPTVNVFASTLEHFLRNKHNAFVRSLHQQLKSSSEPKSLQMLFREFPAPEVIATPMANKGTIDDFLKSFDKLTRLEFQIQRTNAEISRSDTFRRLREMKDELNASSTKLVHNNKEGLNKDAAAEEIDASASAGNQRVSLSGVATDGSELSGSNDNFKLRVPARDVPEVPLAKAKYLVREFFRQVDEDHLRPDESSTNLDKIAQLRKELNGHIARE